MELVELATAVVRFKQTEFLALNQHAPPDNISINLEVVKQCLRIWPSQMIDTHIILHNAKQMRK